MAITQTTVDFRLSGHTDNVAVTKLTILMVQPAQQVVATINSGASPTTHTVTGLTPNTLYQFVYFAEDAAGNVSTNSNTVQARTLP